MQMPADLVVYGMKGSPFVRKVQVCLLEKQLDFEMEGVSIFPPPDWFVEISPARRIPVLRDRSVGTEGVAGTIPDSSAICAYLERKHPEPALYPKDPFDHARALWFEEYGDSELAARIGGNLFRITVVQKLMGREPDLERARKTVNEDLPPLFDYLDGALSDGEYLVGGAFSIADVTVASMFVNFELAGATLDAARWPRLAAWRDRVHGRSSFVRCIEEERKLMPPPGWEL